MALFISIIGIYFLICVIGLVYIQKEINSYKKHEVKDDLYYKRQSIWEELTSKYMKGRR